MIYIALLSFLTCLEQNMPRAEYVISGLRQEPVVYVAKKFDEFFMRHLHLHTLVQLAISL